MQILNIQEPTEHTIRMLVKLHKRKVFITNGEPLDKYNLRLSVDEYINNQLRGIPDHHYYLKERHRLNLEPKDNIIAALKEAIILDQLDSIL